MGQEEVLKVLEKSRVPLSADEISKELCDNITKTSHIIGDLLRHQEIQCVELNKDLAFKFYKCKRKMRLYYI